MPQPRYFDDPRIVPLQDRVSDLREQVAVLSSELEGVLGQLNRVESHIEDVAQTCEKIRESVDQRFQVRTTGRLALIGVVIAGIATVLGALIQAITTVTGTH